MTAEDRRQEQERLSREQAQRTPAVRRGVEPRRGGA
jgi:hypothetical protein